MKHTVHFLSCIAALSLIAAPALAQTPDAKKAALTDALNLIHLYDQGASWHISASVQMVDQGQPGETGTVDVLRNTQGDLRTVYAFPNFHQTRFTTTNGRFIEGDDGDAPTGLENFIQFFNKPARLSELNGATLRTFDFTRKAVKFHCTALSGTTPEQKRTYCSIVSSPVLRYNTLGSSYVTLFEHMTTFQGSDLPDKAAIFFQYQPIARLTLTYAPLSADDAIRMQPSANAIAVKTDVSAQLGHLLNSQLVDPFVHPSPTHIAPPENGAVLFRLELSGGKVKNAEILAASDSTTAHDIAAAVRKTIARASLPPGHRFANYPYVLYVIKPNADANATIPDVGPIN